MQASLGDLQQIGAKALERAPQPLRRALDGLNVRFRPESGPSAPMAGGLGPGNRTMYAGVEKGSPNTISVLDEGAFRKAPEQLVTHEGTHLWVNNLPPSIQAKIPADNPADPYNYGGTQRIANLVKHGGTILDLPREQAAAAMQYGQSQGMPEPYRALAQTMDKIPLSQIDMTEPMAKTINTHPRAPQVPPASVPGMNFANTVYQPGQPAPGDPLMIDPGTMPELPAPAMAKAAYAPDPLQRNIDSDQQKLQKIQFAQQNPWGTANNHPGTLGKIAHVLSVAGNIAGDIVAPNIMARIPGTELNRQVEGNQLRNEINAEEQEKSLNSERAATTQATELANANEPQRAEDTHNLIQSEIGKNNEEAQPKPVDLSHAYGVAVQRAIAAGRDPQADPVVQQIEDAIIRVQPGQNKADAAPKTIDVVRPGSKTPHTYAWDAKTGQYDIDEGEHFEKQPQAPGVNLIVPGPDGTQTLERVRPGQTVGQGAMSPTQFGALNVPTTQQRNVGAQAALVHEQTPQLLQQIDQMHDQLGPVAGRWGEFMQGKIGAPSPAMADLRANLLMYSSAVALMHARGRLPENLREEFDHAINAPQQSPENLKAVINRIDKWTAANMNAMGTHGTNNQPQESAPTPAKAQYRYVPGKGLVAQ